MQIVQPCQGDRISMIRKFANLRIIKHRSILPPLQGSSFPAQFPGAPPRAIFFMAFQAFPPFALEPPLTFTNNSSLLTPISYHKLLRAAG